MSDATRGALADLAVLGGVSLALYFIATKPALRRVVWRAMKYGVLTAAPTVLRQEVTRAWSESAQRHAELGTAELKLP
jgi:hypothetical protein